MAPPDPARPETLLEHADFVRALARSLVRGEPDADDVVQETWLASLRSPPTHPGRERSWLATVVRNFARQAGRGGARRREREEATARPEGVPSTADVLAREEQRRRVVAAVLALEEPYRAVVLLRYFEDLPPREIAQRLGAPVETVRTRLRRALERLRAVLDGQHGGRRSWALLLLPQAGRSPAAAAGPVLVEGILVGTTMKAVVAVGVVAAGIWLAWPGGRPPNPAATPPADRVALTPVKAPATAMETPPAEAHGPSFHGVLLDGDSGTPIQGAKVRVLHPGSGETLTGADGGFLLRSSGAERGTLLAEKQGFTSCERRGAVPGTRLTLRARRWGTLVVRVVDGRGDPVADAEVSISSNDGRTSVMRGGATDAEGRAEWNDLPPGPQYAAALPPAGRTDLAEGRWRGTILPGETVTASLQLVVAMECSGRVVDAETRQPLAGARIRSPRGGRIREWFADGDGRFTFPHFPAGRADLGAGIIASAEGYETKPVNFAPSATPELEVPLQRTISLRFRALGPGSKPLVGARVSVLGMHILPFEMLGEAVTDGEGTCIVDRVSPEEARASFVSAVSADGSLRMLAERGVGTPMGMLVEEQRDGAVTLELAPSNRTLDFRLRSSRLSVEGRRVRVGWVPRNREYAFHARLGRPPRFNRIANTLPAGAWWEADTDPSGQVRMENLPEGALSVEIEGRTDRSWYLPATKPGETVDIDFDEEMPESHLVLGTVKSAKGPVEKAMVHLVSQEGWAGDGSVSGKDGRFRIETFVWPAVRIAVTLQADDGSWRTKEFPLPVEGEEANLTVE